MKIVYINIVSSSSPGVIKKLEKQAKNLKDYNIKTICFVNHDEKLLISEYFETVRLPKFKPKFSLIELPKFLSEYLKEINPDIIYLRYLPQTPFFWFYLRERRYKLVLEYHTLVYDELIVKKRLLMANIYKYSRLICDKIIDGKISVTQEIEKAEYSKYNKSLVIANGTDVKSYPQKKFKQFNHNKILEMIFIGSINQPWHGLDRLILSLKNWKNQGHNDFKLNIVGDINSGEFDITNLENNIVFHGYLSGDKLNKLFDDSHLAFSTLALYRNKMEDACTLKSREYLSRGIPFVYGYNDTDIKDDFKYALKVSNDGEIIDYKEIKKFITDIKSQEDEEKSIPEQIRKYALENVDSKIKNETLVYFLKGLK